MRGRWILVGAAAMLACCFVNVNANAGVVDANTSYGPLETWNGFDADFSPEWKGDTQVVDAWQKPEHSGSSGYISSCGTVCDLDATIMAANWMHHRKGYWKYEPTVRQISSSSDNEVSTAAWLRVNGQDYAAAKYDDGDAELARYARLVSPQNELLVDASAIAYRNVGFGNDSFTADGRVWAEAVLTDAAQEATASARGKSWLKAQYELDRDTAFSLEFEAALLGQIDFSFTAIDVYSGEVVFAFNELTGSIISGVQRKICMDGTLEAGRYEFALSCSTDAAVNSLGQWNPGGAATFDVSLDLKEEYEKVWVPGSGGTYDNGCGGYDNGCVFTIGDFGNYNSPTPEPSTLAMLIFGILGCLIAGRLRRIMS